MHRRELIKAIGGLTALQFIPKSVEAAALLGARIHEQTDASSDFLVLPPEAQQLVIQLCDRILPATDTPGALDVRVPEFIDLLLAEWSSAEDRTKFLDGLKAIDERARSDKGGRFIDLAEDDKIAMMRALDSERESKEGAGAGPAFGQLKSLTVFAYFTSERVTKEILKTRMYFSTYDGNAPVRS